MPFPKSTRPFSAERHLAKKRNVDLADTGNGAPKDDARDAARHIQIMNALGELKNQLGKNTGAGQVVTEDLKRELVESAALRQELLSLTDAIAETKVAIAGLRHPGAADDRLTGMADQLDAVVAATESATESILEASETIEEKAGALRAQGGGTEAVNLVDDISDQVIKIFEACNFQDITGQRITKVVATLKFVEERVERMMEILGGEESFKDIEVPEEAVDDPDKALLQGPQKEGEGVSQADIDALFD